MKDLKTELKNDNRIKQLTERIRATGDMGLLNKLGSMVGEKALEKIDEGLKDSLVDEGYVRSIVAPVMRSVYEYMSDISAVVINRMYEKAGIGLKAIVPSYDTAKENEIIQIRGLKIDRTARRVWVDDEEKTFTTKEFDLLSFLAMNPNHVFTKDELFREIWDMESIGDIATVTVHIKKIREKIEKNTSKPDYIETIWGVGYRFKL